MELKDFVERTLTEIAQGVSEAQKNISNGTRINPSVKGSAFGDTKGILVAAPQGHGENPFENVEFDIAITEESKESTDAKAGVSVLKVVNLGAGGTSSSSSSSLNRIRFRVKIAFPLEQARRS